MKNFTAVFERAEEGGFVCWVEEIPEAMSQGETLSEAKNNLLDALKLVIEMHREQAEIEINGREVIREKISLSAL
jgi:predicted RNase H-like HicB family nuclease